MQITGQNIIAIPAQLDESFDGVVRQQEIATNGSPVLGQVGIRDSKFDTCLRFRNSRSDHLRRGKIGVFYPDPR